MAHYSYKAKTSSSQTVQGVIEALDRQAAVRKITMLGHVPIKVQEISGQIRKDSKERAFNFERKRSRISSGMMAIFLRQLYDLVDAEIPLLRAFDLIEGQTKDLNFKVVIQGVKALIQDGASLSSALGSRHDVFPAHLVFMIKAGEMSGRLKNVLERVCYLLEKHQETSSRIRMGLVYPAFIMTVGAVMVFVLMVFVIPRMAMMFDDLGQRMPWITQALIGSSHALGKFWWAIPGIGLLAFGAWQRGRRTPQGRLLIDQWMITIPLIGNFIRVQELERFARTMGIMLESGVEAVPALTCAQGVIDNQAIGSAVRTISQAVIQGGSLAAAFRAAGIFQPDVVNMIAIGEESGRMEKGFLKWADIYQRDAERQVKTITTLLEPVMILIIGGVVAFMVVALLLPILQMDLIAN